MGTGSIRLNGDILQPGASVFAGDVVSTGPGSAAVIRLLSKASAGVGENTTVSFTGARAAGPGARRASVADRGAQLNGSRINLGHGVLTVVTLDGSPTEVDVSQAAVIAKGQPGFPAICRIALMGAHALVLADRGHVEVHAAGAQIVVPPRKSARFEAGTPQAGTHVAGEIVDSMPDEVVLHPGERVEVALGLGQLVNVGDSIRTLATGRIRLHFLGDPYLNVGPRTAFKITNHNPEGQYTRIDLSHGHVRAEAAGLTKPGASLELRTPDAIISGAGATFLVAALSKQTEACVMDGTITIRRLNSSGFVRVSENQCTRVSSSSDPTPPQEMVRKLQSEIYLTTVVGSALVGPTAYRPPTVAILTAAVDGSAAALAAGGFILIGDARGSLARADSKLASATKSADSAIAEAEAAAQAAQSLASEMQNMLNGFNTFLQAVPPASPSAP
jgi:hypothetical protein